MEWKSKSVRRLGFAGVLAMLLLAACGTGIGQDQTQENQEWSTVDSEYSWKVREKVSMPEDTISSRLALTSQACYELNTETGDLYEFKPDTGSYQELSLNLGENADSIHILYFGAGGDSTLEIITINEEGQTKLTECDTSGNILAQADIPDGLITGNSVDQVLSDDGNWYLLSYGKVSKLDADGTGKVLSDQEFRSLVRLADGVCFLADENGETAVYRMNDAQKLTLWETIPTEGGLAVAGADQESMVFLNSEISCVALSDKTVTSETELVSIGITENTVRQLALGEDCIRLLRYVEGNYQIVTLEKTDATDTRQVVKLLTWANGFYNLEEKVIQFNEENEQYRIEVVNLNEDSLDFYPDHEDSMRELQLLMESDEVPDLVDASVFYDWRDYARKGYLEELDGYIEGSEVISQENYLENLYAAGTENGKTYFVPYSFDVELYWGKTEVVGENAGWTLTELLDVSDAHSEVGVFNADPETSLERLLTMSLSEFVDEDSQSCDFETELFYRLLEKCSETAYQPYEGNDADYTLYTELAENKCLLEWVSVNYPEEILAYNTEWDIGDGETMALRLKGCPSPDGNCCGEARLTCGSYFVIPAKAEQKDGAWAFIEAYQAEYDAGFRYLQIEIPARKDWLETRMDNIISITIEDVKIEEGYVMTEEERALFREIAESARVLTADEEKILEIISEEAPAYFDGDKSAQDVAAIIQSRVGLLLKER